MTIHTVFVAPYFGPTIIHCLNGLTNLPDAKIGVITAVPAEHVPKQLNIAGHYRVDNPLDAGQLLVATRAFQKEWGRVDRLVGFLEHLQSQLADVREELGIPGIHRNVARNFRDKNTMKKVLADAELPVARQKLIRGAEDAFDFIKEVGYPIVMKPPAGVGSKNTVRIGNDEELFQTLNRFLPSANNPWQAEEFITGDEHTLEAVVINGDVVWQSSTYYLPGPLKVIENPWMQYCVLLPREENEPHVEKFRSVNVAALEALGLQTGFSHMEWFERDDGSVAIGEVGARPAGVNIMAMNGFAHDVDLWAKWANLEVHHQWEMPERKYAVGCAFLRGQGAGNQVATVDGVQEVMNAVGETIVARKIPRPGQGRSSHYEGDGWVIVRAPETQDVVDALRRVVTGIQIRYA